MSQSDSINNRTVEFAVSCCIVFKQVEVSTILVSVKSAGLGDITSLAAMIGYLKVNQLNGCHTQTTLLDKVAVDNTETICSQ